MQQRDPIDFLKLRGPAVAIALSALVALVLVVNAAGAVTALRRVVQAEAWVNHTHETLEQLQAFAGSIHDVERVQRSYLLTGDPSYRKSYAVVRQDVELHARRLDALVRGDPVQEARLAALRPVVAQRLDVLQRGVELRAGSDGFARGIALVRSGLDRELADRIDALVEEMASEEEARLVDRSRASDEAWRIGLVAVGLGLLASLGVLAAAIRAFRGRLRERSLAAAQLHEEKERLRATLTSIGDGVVVTDEAGRIEILNETAREITGAGDSALGRPLGEVFRRVSERTHLPVECPVEAVLRPGRKTGPSERVLLVRPDGAEVPIEESAAPVRDVDGRVVGVVLVLRDNRARRAAERELARRAELLEEQDRRKDEFLAVLSHELRNPLAAVRNGMAVLARAPADSDPARRAREIVDRQSGHLARMVDDLLDVSRIASGRIRIEKRRLDLADVVRRAVEDARPTVEARGLAVTVVDGAGPVWVDADATRIAQVATNLVHNACKFTDPGGRVTVEVAARDGRAVLRVSDTGAGMDAALLARLFQPFVQAEDTLHRTAGGLGLGLAIARSIVELHGGTISAASEGRGKGAEFEVRLPLLAAPLEAATPAHRPAQAEGAVRVLVIEDNEDSAESLRDILELQGHEVSVAHDGPEGLARARAAEPDVVLCDVGIPGLDGYEVARRLRAAGTRARLVALTGYAGAEDVARAHQAGFDAHLAKPPDLERLERLLVRPGGAARPST
ncbi:MAG TPA: CHASE3 domain-containing protein [Anaeromyxobacter sp.]|nr:CHASE3 domain-containing protein [Anaeromyxobacter sp.]